MRIHYHENRDAKRQRHQADQYRQLLAGLHDRLKHLLEIHTSISELDRVLSLSLKTSFVLEPMQPVIHRQRVHA